jgi:hypothetical protein
MRQSGYFGGGLLGAINAEEFQERCLAARGYYKVRASQEAATSTAVSSGTSYGAGSPSCSGTDKKAQIEALQRKLDGGLMTRDEFETERAHIIMEPVFGACGH